MSLYLSLMDLLMDFVIFSCAVQSHSIIIIIIIIIIMVVAAAEVAGIVVSSSFSNRLHTRQKQTHS